MGSEILAYIAIIVVSTVTNLFVLLYAYVKRHTYSNIVNFFLVHMLGMTIYCFTNIMWLLSTDIKGAFFWTVIMYVGISFTPPLGLLFVLRYFGVEVSKKIIAALMVIPTLTMIILATNDMHYLHYRVFEIDPVLGAPFVYQEEGYWYIVQGMYGFACMFAASIFTLSRWKETHKKYRSQLITLACGQLIPISVSFLYLLGFAPRGIDPVPMILWITSLLYLWSIKSSGLFTTIPIAKDTIFNNINDGLVVLNSSRQLIEFNKAFHMMFPQINNTNIGSNFLTLWSTLTAQNFPYEFTDNSLTEQLKIGEGDTQKIYQIRITPVQYITRSKEHLIVFTDITELKLLQGKLERQAFYDELANIYNRRAFFEQSEQLHTNAVSNELPYAVILLDIDYFKRVNDTYGHQIGDEIIIHVVNVCKELLPEEAIFARYGGEEFVISVNGYTKSQAVALANKLCAAVEKNVYVSESGPIAVTISLGIAVAGAQQQESLQQLLNKADQALYAAKNAGRNRIAVFEEIHESQL